MASWPAVPNLGNQEDEEKRPSYMISLTSSQGRHAYAWYGKALYEVYSVESICLEL